MGVRPCTITSITVMVYFLPISSSRGMDDSRDCILEAFLLAAAALASSGSIWMSDLNTGSAPNSAGPDGTKSFIHSLDCSDILLS